LLFLAGAPTAAAQPAAAQNAPYYPWCAHYGGGEMGSAISCGFVTYGRTALLSPCFLKMVTPGR